jgi:hypothetical protein
MAAFVETPKIGDTVYFYRPGTADVVPATVTGVFGPDMINVQALECGMSVSKNAIHRKGCQTLLNSPSIAQFQGYWDYRDPPEVREAMRTVIQAAIDRQNQVPKKA